MIIHHEHPTYLKNASIQATIYRTSPLCPHRYSSSTCSPALTQLRYEHTQPAPVPQRTPYPLSVQEISVNISRPKSLSKPETQTSVNHPPYPINSQTTHHGRTYTNTPHLITHTYSSILLFPLLLHFRASPLPPLPNRTPSPLIQRERLTRPLRNPHHARVVALEIELCDCGGYELELLLI